jgi:hypothetical protein
MRPPPPPPRVADTTTVSAAEPEAGPSDTEIDEDKALEIKLKSDPEAARRYRSPRKAFFLSLMVPGAGQVYCGSYVKAGFFAATEIGLGYAWWKIAIVDARRKEQQADQFAALHWRQQRYEETWKNLVLSDTVVVNNAVRSAIAPNRQSYCDAIYGSGSSSAADSACLDIPGHPYSTHASLYSVGGASSTDSGAWSQDSVLSFRSRSIRDLTSFRDLIGRYDEFASGWEDNPNTATLQQVQNYYALLVDNDPSTNPGNLWGTSSYREQYQAMRSRADHLARMQKWFLGGMVLNHLAAAFDAAFQASRMNRSLLELQTSWLDGIGVQGGLAFDASSSPTLHAQMDWSF